MSKIVKGERKLRCATCKAVVGKVANDHYPHVTEESYFCGEPCLEQWRKRKIGIALDVDNKNPTGDEIERAYRKKYFGEG